MNNGKKIIQALPVILIFFATLFVLVDCQEDRKVDTSGTSDALPQEETVKEDSNTFAVTVGNTTYTAEFEDSETADAFKKLLPLTADMVELNGNEKYFKLPEALPETDDYTGQIKAGDIMLYGNDTLVLFYKDFETTYSYTPIGKIVDPAGMENVLGNENITVTFE